MSTMNAQQVNQALWNQLDDSAAKTKISAKFNGFVKDRLRELEFTGKVIPNVDVTRDECQVSTQHEGLVKMEFIQPRSKAMVMNFRGEPTARFIRGERAEVAFFCIMSEKFQKPEQEFLAYPYPIAQVIEEQAVMDLGEIVDREFTINIEAAVQAHQLEANGVATALNATSVQAGSVVESSITKGELARNATSDSRVALPIQRPDFPRLFNLLDGNRLESSLVLLGSTDFNNILGWTVEDQGAQIQSETLINGYKYNLLLGKKFVRTIKTDILRPGNVYVFTEPDFLGRYYTLNGVKFYIDKVINLLTFVAWKDVGMSILNTASVRKLELYSGDANPQTDDDSILTAITPVTEEGLGTENNRVANRQFFPQVANF